LRGIKLKYCDIKIIWQLAIHGMSNIKFATAQQAKNGSILNGFNIRAF
jgi:hypothetical protein